MYSYTTNVRMGDTDAAGVIYFANQFRIADQVFGGHSGRRSRHS